jgi:hypothetical protein
VRSVLEIGPDTLTAFAMGTLFLPAAEPGQFPVVDHLAPGSARR